MAKKRMLIVDDVSQVRQDLCMVLRLLPYDLEIVGEAANGLEAIQQTEALQPDVILMDLEMPLLDGYRATQEIKSQHPSCWVIALTIHDYNEARQKAFQAGADAFILKGEPVQNLVQAILDKKE